MTNVFFVFGPQGSGKTTFCRKYSREHSEVVSTLSRDKFFMSSFLNKDSQGVHKFLYAIRSHIGEKRMLLVDSWVYRPMDMAFYIEKIRLMQSGKITGVFCTTPKDVQERWRENKGISGLSGVSGFDREIIDLFDSMIYLNPAQYSFFGSPCLIE